MIGSCSLCGVGLALQNDRWGYDFVSIDPSRAADKTLYFRTSNKILILSETGRSSNESGEQGVDSQQAPRRKGKHPPDTHERALRKAAGCLRAAFIDIEFKSIPATQSGDCQVVALGQTARDLILHWQSGVRNALPYEDQSQHEPDVFSQDQAWYYYPLQIK